MCSAPAYTPLPWPVPMGKLERCQRCATCSAHSGPPTGPPLEVSPAPGDLMQGQWMALPRACQDPPPQGTPGWRSQMGANTGAALSPRAASAYACSSPAPPGDPVRAQTGPVGLGSRPERPYLGSGEGHRGDRKPGDSWALSWTPRGEFWEWGYRRQTPLQVKCHRWG